jgi:methyltransferase (TIGR00027 family)
MSGPIPHSPAYQAREPIKSIGSGDFKALCIFSTVSYNHKEKRWKKTVRCFNFDSLACRYKKTHLEMRDTEDKNMNPVSNTAFYCCGVRMLDAEKKKSVCRDIYAERFMDEKGRQIFEPFRSEKMPNISNITRCRIIDDYLSNELKRNRNMNIITIGAGFDTRPYRLTGGKWTELDEPQIISYKNEKLPLDECRNPLKRIPIEFASETLEEKLGHLDKNLYTVFVIEGVFMYLETGAIEDTLKALQRMFPGHVLYCDLMTRNFFDKFAKSVHSKLAAAGGKFTERPRDPQKVFIHLNYDLVEQTPMFMRARELGILWDEARIPRFMAALLLNVFMKDLKGYSVCHFHYNQFQ